MYVPFANIIDEISSCTPKQRCVSPNRLSQSAIVTPPVSSQQANSIFFQ
jgi:hypothetical protein